MPRFAHLPLAVRLAAAFALQAVALLLVAVLALNAFGDFSADTDELAERDVRAVSLAGEIGQHWQLMSRLAADHLYVHDGDLKAQDGIAKTIAENHKDSSADATELAKLMPESAELARVQREAAAWKRNLDKALELSRAETVDNVEERDGSRDLYTGKVAPASDAIFAAVEELQHAVEASADRTAAGLSADAGSRSKMLLVVVAVSLLLAAGFAVVITRSVVVPVHRLMRRLRSLDEHDLNDLTAGLEAAAQGDLTLDAHAVTEPLRATSNDELGQLGQTFDAMLGKAQRSVAAYTTMRAELGTLLGAVSRSAGTVSAGSQQVASSSEEAGRAVAEIASAVTDVAQGAERQVRMVESTRGAVLEANAAAGASASAALATAAAAEEAREVAREGVAAAASATEAIQSVAAASASVGNAIEDLSARSEKIGGIVTTITGLAEQTNLLALNAAIEAARAGEQGRGFAVVAEEVRKLAEESQRAAAEIATLIGEMQAQTRQVVGVVADGAARTDEGVATVERTREAFLLIDQAVEGVGAQIASIAAAVEQISAGSARAEGDVAEVAAVAEQSSASAEQVSASTQQTSASTQEIAASAAHLAATADELDALVRRFKVSA